MVDLPADVSAALTAEGIEPSRVVAATNRRGPGTTQRYELVLDDAEKIYVDVPIRGIVQSSIAQPGPGVTVSGTTITRDVDSR